MENKIKIWLCIAIFAITCIPNLIIYFLSQSATDVFAKEANGFIENNAYYDQLLD